VAHCVKFNIFYVYEIQIGILLRQKLLQTVLCTLGPGFPKLLIWAWSHLLDHG